ncbi:MAG: dephospho-CoA kinase [Eubacteriales bacterium]|nr:dephospho-CoA kinase [Eubacteriales bacterium]MDD4323308.1 dephospho-CoA kinase [Eubacteriales bacterium]MDD4540581.1 dephospho-CoA kinase [Eubacteriales bacterium]
MFVIGITGGIGTGKTTVASIVKAVGIPVLDADQISHELTDKPSPTLDKIFAVFGEDLKNEAGTLDRSKMADLVFQNKRALDQLESIVHEDVMNFIISELNQARRTKTRVIALDVPIPVKHGFLDQSDLVWVVTCSREKRIQRLMRRGLSQEDAERRLAVQMTDEEYQAIADYVIDNNGSLEELYQKVRSRLKLELESRGIKLAGL